MGTQFPSPFRITLKNALIAPTFYNVQEDTFLTCFAAGKKGCIKAVGHESTKNQMSNIAQLVPGDGWVEGLGKKELS